MEVEHTWRKNQKNAPEVDVRSDRSKDNVRRKIMNLHATVAPFFGSVVLETSREDMTGLNITAPLELARLSTRAQIRFRTTCKSMSGHVQRGSATGNYHSRERRQMNVPSSDNAVELEHTPGNSDKLTLI